ncbi:MAG: SEL1-like repeat protein [Alphaproteobacteria bacterium]|nr:SEL1-like repeat protein [Alphaproteobacteria bacterium]
MNSKRSYIDAINAGRQRRSYASLEQLNRSLETLEQRIDRNREEVAGYSRAPARQDSPPAYEAPRRPEMPRSSENRSAFEQPYRSIARDIERVRSQEDGVAAFGKISEEIKGLREELRNQVTSGVRREFETLRQEIERAAAAGSGRALAQLGQDVERLSGTVQSLAERSDDKNVNMLRLEIEQMRDALDMVAREETVRSVDRRWDDFDRRFSDFQDHVSSVAAQRPGEIDLSGLTSRIEQINDAVGRLPESQSIRSLEDKVRTLAGALDHFIEQQGGKTTETFGQIEERLDEISRAIVSATVAAQTPQFDPEPFERIEARMSALARQIEEVVEDRPTGEIISRLNMLSERVDEMAAHNALPDETLERLAHQIASIADKIDRAPPMPDANEIFSGIEQRFEVLSGLMERRQGDALEQGNMLFRELERRLDEVAERIERRQGEATLDNSGIMSVIDERFSAMAKQLEGNKPDKAAEAAIRGLEARLESIARQIDQSASQYTGIDPDLVRNLESQVAGLSAHLSQPNAPLPAYEDISPRLEEIEKSIAGSRETVLEAARDAAENAAKSLAGSQAESAAVAGLAQDLKSLEALTRRSDERNSKTFEAIHDTLLKIVDRLGSLEGDGDVDGEDDEPAPLPRKKTIEDAPSIDAEGTLALDEPLQRDDSTVAPPPAWARTERTPAEAAAAAAIAALGDEPPADAAESGRGRSMLGALTRALGKKKQAPATVLAGPDLPDDDNDVAPSVDLDAPLDPKIANRPLEPGSGTPDLNAIMKRVRDERGQTARVNDSDAAKSDFIAAARRAAQAAAAESQINRRKTDIGSPVKALRIGDLLKSRRKPILMGTAVVMLALAGLQLGKAFMQDEPNGSSDLSAKAQLGATAEPEMAALDDATIQDMDSEPEMAAGDQALEDASDDLEGSDMDMMAGATEEQPMDDVAAAMDEMEPAMPEQSAAETEEPEAMEQVKVAAVSPPETVTASLGDTGEAAEIVIDVPAEAGPVLLREAAESGDPKALFEIATRYADGRGVKSDMTRAASWYEKSAEFGFAPAQYRIGNLYEKGLGVQRDLKKSRQWYLQAAEQGNASAMHNLAVLDAMGAEGVSDNDSAAKWFTRAAELGVKDSQFNLGILTAKGVGMPQSLEESYKWFALVAKTGDKDAADKRDEIANALRPEQLERARAATELWKAKELNAEANSVDIPDSWREAQDQTASVDMTKAIKNIQVILNKNGYQAGNPDGVLGGKTKSAIAAFQKDNGMKPTGEIDQQVARALLDRK